MNIGIKLGTFILIFGAPDVIFGGLLFVLQYSDLLGARNHIIFIVEDRTIRESPVEIDNLRRYFFAAGNTYQPFYGDGILRHGIN